MQVVHLLLFCFSCLCSCLHLFPMFLTRQGDGVSGQLGRRLVVFGWAVHPDQMHESPYMIRTGLVGGKGPREEIQFDRLPGEMIERIW
ncbi:hypothetical protein V8C26DRAFT_393392 [Trichoderma gracile]